MAGAGRAKLLQRQLGARGLLAVLGGYAVAALACILMARVLPLERADATVLATILSFSVYASAAIWSFAARSLAQALLGFAVAGGGLYLAAWCCGGVGAGL